MSVLTGLAVALVLSGFTRIPQQVAQHGAVGFDNDGYFTFGPFGFAFRIPGEWEPIPDSLVDVMSVTATNAAGRKVRYVAGFQIGPSDFWLAYPYILVEVFDSIPVTEEELVNVLAGPGSEEILENTENVVKGSGLVSRAKLNTPIWDDVNRVLWMRLSGVVGNGEEVGGLTAFKVYGPGYFAIHYYYRPGVDVDTIQSRLAAVINTARYDPGYEYDPAKVQAARRSAWLERVLGGAVIGALIGVFSTLFRRGTKKVRGG